jgi:uncharacterized protein (TIGR02099 family)
MRAATRQILRKIWFGSWALVTAVLILLALMFSAIRLLLPLATEYQGKIEATAAAALKRPLQIEEVSTDWKWFSPRLRLAGVKLLDAQSGQVTLAAHELIFGIDILGSLLQRGVQIDSITIVGTDVSLSRDADGKLYVQGIMLPAQSEQTDALQLPAFLQNRKVHVIDSKVHLQDAILGLDYRLQSVNLSVYQTQKKYNAYLSVLLPESLGKRLEMGFELRGALPDLKDLHTNSGEFYLRGDDLKLPAWASDSPYRDLIRGGELDIAVWISRRHDKDTAVRGNFDLRDFSGNSPGLAGWPERLAADFRAMFAGGELELDLENFSVVLNEQEWPVGGLSLKGPVQRQAMLQYGELAADFLRIQDMALLAQKSPALAQILTDAHITAVQGDVRHLYARWGTFDNRRRLVDLITKFERIGVTGEQTTPTIAGISGMLHVHNGIGIVEFETDGAELDYPHMFRNKLSLAKLAGPVFFDYSAGHVRLAARDLIFNTPHIATRHWFDVDIQPGRSPYVDAYAMYENGDIQAGKQYFPVSVMSAGLLNWLDAAFVSGRVTRGDFEMRGPLQQFPFRQQEGIFRIEFDCEDARIAYYKKWPQLTDFHAHAKFLNQGVAIAVQAARVYDTEITAEVRITDFKQSILQAHAGYYGPLADDLRYLRETSLGRYFGRVINNVEGSGMRSSVMQLDLPLHGDSAENQFNFRTSVFDTGLNFQQLGLRFDKVTAELHYGTATVSATPFRAELNGFPVTAQIATTTEEAGPTANIRIEGDVGLAELLVANVPTAKEYVQGASRLQAMINLPLSGGGSRHTSIVVHSDLLGTEVKLPAPFYKPVNQPAATALTISFLPEDLLLADLRYADWINGKLLFQSAPGRFGLERADVRIGKGESKLPAATGVFIQGDVPALNLDRWLEAGFWRDGAQSGGPQVERVKLQVGEFTYLQRTINNATLVLRPLAEDWKIDVRSEYLSGSVLLPKRNLKEQGLTIDLDFYDFDQLNRGVADGKLSPLDMLPLQMTAKKMIVNGWHLQDVKLLLESVERGLLIRSIRIDDPDIGLNGEGSWLLDKRDRQRTRLDLIFNSKNLGNGLTKFGYAHVIKDGEGTLTLDIDWPGAPPDFNTQTVEGSVDISVKDGQILDIEPGGGRLFGLLSVQTIPRRLAFDFKDIFTKGLHFDKMKGHFDFKEGDAHTLDYYIDGPAGRIDISGRVGLVQRDYDQKILFRPDLSSSLPLIGTLLGGTGAGVAIILADRVARLFGKQADDLARFEYTLTGSWEDPVMTPVIKEKRKKSSARSRNKRSRSVPEEAQPAVVANPPVAP